MPEINHMCYMFELVTPLNTIVVKYKENALTLIGCRDLRTLSEVDPFPVAQQNGWACVKTYPITSLNEALEAAKLLNPMENEGFVVRDASFQRIKIKSPQYVALHHISSK